MQTYLLSAAGVIFLSVIVSLIVPEGKLNKTITFVMRLICIFVLVQPITGVFNLSPSDTERDFFDSAYVCAEYSDHQSAQLEALLKDKFGAECECGVDVEYVDSRFKVQKVEVTVFGKDENLIEEIQAYLKELGYINISVYAKSS